MTTNDKEILEYALNSYSFLLPFNGEFDFDYFHKAIVSAYDSANCRTTAVAEVVKNNKGTITRRNGVSFMKIG